MRLLVVAATPAEIAPLSGALGAPTAWYPRLARPPGRRARHRCRHGGDCRQSRPGTGDPPVRRGDQPGVCGSFDRTRPLGAVVHVTTDGFPELGVEDGDRFVSAAAIGLVDANAAPFCGGLVVNHTPPAWPALRALPAVTGVTVNTVHGFEPSIARSSSAATRTWRAWRRGISLRLPAGRRAVRPGAGGLQLRGTAQPAAWKLGEAIEA